MVIKSDLTSYGGVMQATHSSNSKPLLLAALIFLSWLGAYIHTTYELQLPIWRWEHSFPAVVGLVLFLAWWRQSRWRRTWVVILLGWTTVAHLVIGAILSVLPVPLWPFYPEQSLSHYLSHVIYGVAQLPLIWVLIQALK
jgi:hypothetical protein